MGLEIREDGKLFDAREPKTKEAVLGFGTEDWTVLEFPSISSPLDRCARSSLSSCLEGLSGKALAVV